MEFLHVKAGDQIIATEVDYYTYNEEIRARKVISQKPGDIIMVNNPNYHDSVGGYSIYGPHKGKGNMLTRGKFRMATPDDLGYLGTKDEWEFINSGKLESAVNSLAMYKVLFVTTLVMLVWIIASSV